MRLFISIELPDRIKEKIEKKIGKLKLMLTPIRWVDKKNLHLTLKFLGWVEDKKVESLIKSVEGCTKGFSAFDIELGGMGVFPEEKHPRVIWIGMKKGYEQAKAIADLTECDLAQLGYRKEEREFSPHLTIGRVKEKLDVEELNKFIEKNEESDFGAVKIDHISVMKSTLRRNGPIYDEIRQIKLKKGES